MSTDFIPYDLVVDILSRLIVKTLTRFKCVSKAWLRMIDSPDFIKTHLKQSKSNMKLIAKVARTGGAHLYDVGFTLDELSNMKEINYPVIMDDYIYRISIAGSCNGLICLSYWGMEREETIVLWNPSTRKHIQLPNRRVKYPERLGMYYVSSHGLVYDERTDDYKVVQLTNLFSGRYEFSIFSLKANKWEVLEVLRLRDGLFESNYTVLANGSLHWLLNNNFILVFNFETEGYQMLPPPETSTSIECACLSVAFLSGCQYLVFEDISAGQKWITKDKCGSNYSWTKLTFDFSAGKQLLIMRMPYYSKSYEVFEFEKLEVEFPVKVKYLQAHLCFESLVRLDDACAKNDVTSLEESKGIIYLLKKMVMTCKKMVTFADTFQFFYTI